MIQVGQFNKLKVVKKVIQGLYLDGLDDGEILLPAREVPEGIQPDETLEVFIYFDSEDRLIATLEAPLAMVGEFAHLKVKAIDRVGAFLDWGLAKDLFLPFAEQSRELRPGQYVVVYLYIDKSDRISASMRLDRNLSKEPGTYQVGEEVSLFIAARTDIGFKAIINGKHWGVLYFNEVFETLDFGMRPKGYIKTIRPDGKIDLTLQKLGHKAADDIGEKILKALGDKGGFLPLNEKTPPETIYRMFGVSKKKYKMAIGGLYKKRQILIEDEGIRLVKV